MIRVIFSNNNSTWFQAAFIRILNLMNPVSAKIGGHLDRYMAKVTLDYEGHTDNETLDILREAAYLKEAFCASCDVFVYDLDEEGNPDNCYMFKKPISYKCDTYPKRINVEIEFGEVHDGPNIDKKCEEIEKLRYWSTVLRKLMKEKFDETSKNEGDDNVKHFSEHSNMCATCSSKGHCMAGSCILLQIARIQEANHAHISDNNKKEGDDNMKQKSFFECDAKTGADMKFRDWLDLTKTATFVTYLDHKYYSLELKSSTSFDFHTVSDSCLKSLTAYTYEVSDKHPVPVNCHKLSSIKSFTCKHESNLYRIILDFYEELENDDVEKYCCEKEFIDKMFPKSSSEGDCLDFQLIKRRDVDNNSSDKDTKSEATARISKYEYYLKIAEAVSLRGTCLRRKFGAIIVKDDRIVSTGYVGAPRGRINCCDRGTCYRMEHNVPSGQRYELCRSTHAEMNAIIQASPEEMKDATLYLVGIENDGSYTNADCCSMCKRVIINSGIKTVIARQADGSFKTIHVSEWINNDDSLDIDHKGY